MDASWLANQLKANPDLEVVLEMNCRALPDVEQGNVIGEWRGSELPDEIITIGGHLDSWDIGEGAHDDGAGIVLTLEVLRILKALVHPTTDHSIRFVHRENGNRGGKTYAARAQNHTTTNVHVAALESMPGDSSLGIRIDAGDKPQRSSSRKFVV